MKYQITQFSMRGARHHNEDRVGYAERDNAILMAVADGLGGHRGGDVAAEIMVQTLLHMFQTLRHPLIQRPSMFLALGILQAHHAIIARGQAGDPPIEPPPASPAWYRTATPTGRTWATAACIIFAATGCCCARRTTRRSRNCTRAAC